MEAHLETRTVTDDLHSLLGVLPGHLQDAVNAHREHPLLEVVMDLGRPAQARFPGASVELTPQPVSREDLDHVVRLMGSFGRDNRAGLEGTLHRISAIRNRQGNIVGLTLRVGRAVFGTIDLIRDLVESGKSTLLLGRPGIGKTTKLREIARVLADDFQRRVIVIDTSNEIAGDGDIPHPAIGSARRMQVPTPDAQHAVMIEAVENHMPEVIIVDEIGTAAEANAARTIGERGVQLIGTAHGNNLDNLVRNPTLSDLVGGVQTVTLSDEEARFRGSQKTISERKTSPTFNAVVEMVEQEELIVHPDTGQAVDKLLRGIDPGGLFRSAGRAAPETTGPAARRESPTTTAAALPRQREVRVYPYGLSRDSIDRVIRELRLRARTVTRPQQADLILTLKNRAEDERLQEAVQLADLPIHTVKKNSTAQIKRLLEKLFHILPGEDDSRIDDAVREARDAVDQVIEEGMPVELPPRPPALRKLQHRIAVDNLLLAESTGSEPERHLVIHPGEP